MKQKQTIRQFLIVIVVIALSIHSTIAQEKLSFSDVTSQTKQITTKYFKEYIQLDFESMKSQMSDDISFNDTTAKLIFGTELAKGKSNVYENFKKTYASIIEMKYETTRTIFSSNTGVFEINLTYQFKVAKDKIITISKMPLIVILTVKDGKVIEHKDYGDYTVFLKQYNNQLKS